MATPLQVGLTGLVILLVLYIVYVLTSKRGPSKAQQQQAALAAANSRRGSLPAGCLPGIACDGDYNAANLRLAHNLRNSSYDNQAYGVLGENKEFFEVCGTDSDTKSVADCVCGSAEGEFTKYEYGAPNMDYDSFVMSQAVDDQVIVNHANYIKNRKEFGTSGEYTGRTYSPDSHDSYDPIKWQGLRRPEYVQQCNPTQVPDIDTNLYKGNRSFCFKT